MATTVGSDHYPVLCSVGGKLEVGSEDRIAKGNSAKADWESFKNLSDDAMVVVEVSGSIDDVNNKITSAIIVEAEEAIPKGEAG